MAADQKAPAIAAGGAVRASAAPKQSEPKPAGDSEPGKAPPDAAAEIERDRAELEEARRTFQAERELAEEDLRAQREDLAKQCGEIERGRAELAKAAQRFAEESAQRVAGTGRVLRVRGRYAIATGHSIVTARGVLAPGTEVTLTDFGGSTEALEAHIRKGRVVES